MNTLAEALKEYIAIRRALGFDLRHTARTLPQFVSFLDREEPPFITTQLALRWAQEKVDASSNSRAERLAMVRRFAVWRSAVDPRTEIPPRGLLPSRYQRPVPYIYSEDEIERIISSAASLPSTKGLRSLTCSTLFGLLAVSGMRVSEAVALDRDDIDLQTGVLSIRRAKFGKSRFIPIHSTTRDMLADYSNRRDAILPALTAPTFFVSDRGRRMTKWSAEDNFVKVLRAIGLRSHGDGHRFGHGPRLHDLRHRFAVSTLVHWYRSRADVEREIPKLATYGTTRQSCVRARSETAPYALGSRISNNHNPFGDIGKSSLASRHNIPPNPPPISERAAQSHTTDKQQLLRCLPSWFSFVVSYSS